MPSHDLVEDGGLADQPLDDEVHDEDADHGSIIVGKEPAKTCTHKVAPLPLPKLMTPAEYARHVVTHMPYHPGCPFCVMGRRPNSHHRRRPSKARAIPHVVADYGFLKCRDEDLVTMLVVYISPWKIYVSTVCDVKGPEFSVAHRVAQLFKECGRRHFSYKSDREPASRALLLEAARLASATAEPEDDPEDSDLDEPDAVDDNASHVAKDSPAVVVNDQDAVPAAVPETSSPGESQSNGAAERSIQLIEDLSRTLKLCLEDRIKAKIPSGHPVLEWLIMYTGTLMTKCHVSGEDLQTGYQRLHGEPAQDRVPEFGGVVYFFVPNKYRSKWDARWRVGVYLGRSWNSDQNFIGLPSGHVTRARGMVRLVENKRWSRQRLELITMTPSTEKPITLDQLEEDLQPHAPPAIPEEQQDDVDPKLDPAGAKRVRITHDDLRQVGYTESGCPKCNLHRLAQHQRARGSHHSEACRMRVYQELRKAGSLKIQAADNSGRSSSRSTPAPLPGKVYAQEKPREVEEFAIEVNPDDMSLLELVSDDQPMVSSVVPAEHSVAYADLVNVLQVLGVEPVIATRYVCSIKKHDPVTVMELYVQGRVVKMANSMRDMNITGLDALDLRTCRPDGQPWDFRIKAHRDLAEQYVRERKPLWLIGCPPCVAWSSFNQGLNYKKMDATKVQQYLQEGLTHLAFVCKLYQIQLDENRFFLHEHPASAKSWQEHCVTQISDRSDVGLIVGHQCQYGLETPDLDGRPTPALKPTRWMSNSQCMLNRLGARCPGDHIHQPLVGGRAKAAQIYPDKLLLEILRGMVDQADASMLKKEEEEEETKHAAIASLQPTDDNHHPPTQPVSMDAHFSDQTDAPVGHQCHPNHQDFTHLHRRQDHTT